MANIIKVAETGVKSTGSKIAEFVARNKKKIIKWSIVAGGTIAGIAITALAMNDEDDYELDIAQIVEVDVDSDPAEVIETDATVEIEG